jgi:hypothetical protein
VYHSDDLLFHHQQSHALYAAECGTSKLSVVEGCARVALPCHVALSKRLALHVNYMCIAWAPVCVAMHVIIYTSAMLRHSSYLNLQYCNAPIMQGDASKAHLSRIGLEKSHWMEHSQVVMMNQIIHRAARPLESGRKQWS